jgi:iron complex outermembrane receptor protein
VSAKYHLTDNSHIFGGAGRSIRTPTSVERYLQSPSPYFYGNPNLDPTKNTEFDLGFQTAGERYSLRVKGFFSDLDDYIYQQGKKTEASPQTWTNIDAHIYGADFQAVIDIAADLSLEAAASYQRGRKDSQPDENNDKDLAQIPPLKTKLALNYEHSDFFGTIEWIYSHKADHIDADAGEVTLSGWNVVNFRAGYQHNPHFSLNVGIENIFDEHYAVANSYEWDVVSGSGATPAIVYEPGRFCYATISYMF